MPVSDFPCFALLDDAHSEHGVSRLYTDLATILICPDAQSWPAFWRAAEQGLQQGQYALALLAYETGAQLQGLETDPSSAAGQTPSSAQSAHSSELLNQPSKILLFNACQLLDRQGVQNFLEAQIAALPEAEQHAGIAGLQASVDEAQFCHAIHTIQDYIAAGDTYQVNYTYRLHFQVYAAPLALYQRLRQRQPVPYGALIYLPDGSSVLSLSPELFVRHQAGQLIARPMKGTAAATGDAQQDQLLAEELSADSKNRAENLMIVDLLRNDLGRIAVTGSVKVPDLFEVQRFSSVLQMTSTVSATLRPELHLSEMMTALFPCGSITGAPKKRSMEIIRETESQPRGLYTGAIGWFDPPDHALNQNIADFCVSVPIRTISVAAPDGRGLRQAVLGVGAGIVYDSVAQEEFAECQLKASFLTGLPAAFELFETMHASRAESCRHIERHLKRLQKSAQYFRIPCDLPAIRLALENYCQSLPADQAYRLRLGLQPDGQMTLQGGKLLALGNSNSLQNSQVNVLLSDQFCQTPPALLGHKTSQRAEYDAAWRLAEQKGAFDCLFFNQNGHLTEGGRSNVFIHLDGRWFTPPVSDGLLPGIMREVLLEDVQMKPQERHLTRADVLAADQIILCNSLRGVLHAQLQFDDS